MFIDITPTEKLEKGKYYSFEINCELPWIRVNICLGPMGNEVKPVEKSPSVKRAKSSDWLNYTASGALSLGGLSLTQG